MLLSAVSVLVVAQSSSEIPEGLMNNPVLPVQAWVEEMSAPLLHDAKIHIRTTVHNRPTRVSNSRLKK